MAPLALYYPPATGLRALSGCLFLFLLPLGDTVNAFAGTRGAKTEIAVYARRRAGITLAPAPHQVRLTDEGPAQRDEVGNSLFDQLLSHGERAYAADQDERD